MRGLEGRVALVTGASGGIGRATVERLISEGAIVHASDLASCLPDIAGARGVHALDVTEPDAWTCVIAAIVDQGSGFDILINNAGASTQDVITDPSTVDLDAWRMSIRVNADGCFLGCRTVWPVLGAARPGAIVNISSLASFVGTPFDPAYGAAKAAVMQLTRSYALAGAGRRPPVRCNSVHPGVIWTDMWKRHAARLADASGNSIDAIQADLSARIPMGRPGTAEEVASVIAFLASEDAGYVTGQAIVIDGGMTAG